MLLKATSVCPWLSARDRCEWHVMAPSVRTTMLRTWQRRLQLDRRMRPVLAGSCYIGKGRALVAAMGRDTRTPLRPSPPYEVKGL